VVYLFGFTYHIFEGTEQILQCSVGAWVRVPCHTVQCTNEPLVCLAIGQRTSLDSECARTAYVYISLRSCFNLSLSILLHHVSCSTERASVFILGGAHTTQFGSKFQSDRRNRFWVGLLSISSGVHRKRVGSKLRSFKLPSFTRKEVDGECLIEYFKTSTDDDEKHYTSVIFIRYIEHSAVSVANVIANVTAIVVCTAIRRRAWVLHDHHHCPPLVISVLPTDLSYQNLLLDLLSIH
jgi:hypothetical protein